MNALDLKANRKRLGLTQEDLADKLGVDRRTIINYEKGEVIPDPIVKLLHILFDGNNEEHNDPITDAIIKSLFGSKNFLEKFRETTISIFKQEKKDYTDDEYREVLLAELRKFEEPKAKK